MLKVHFRHEELKNGRKAAMAIVYESEASKDGTHISANCVFYPNVFKKINQKDIEDFFDKMIPALEECYEAVRKQKEKENDNASA
jgi:hypothetical protein